MAATRISMEGSLGLLASRVTYLMRRQFAEGVTAAGVRLTAEEWIVTATLAERGPMSQTALAEVLLRDRTTVTRLLDGLVEAGLVLREHDRSDRRVVLASLTPAGMTLARRIMPMARRMRETQTEGISPKDLETTFRTLERVRSNLRRQLGE